MTHEEDIAMPKEDTMNTSNPYINDLIENISILD